MLEFEDRVKNEKYRMTINEEELIDYIKNNKQAVSQMKIVVLAEELYVAPNTITRFCHKLGYESFSELKLNLKSESKSEVLDNYQYVLNKNFELIDKDREEKAAHMMSKARAVNFYALDQTGLLLRVSMKNFYARENKFQFFEYQSDIKRKIRSGSNEVFFFASITGESQSVIELAEYAKSKNHKVITLTNLSENTLSKIADISLYCYAQEERVNDYDVTDKTPLMIIVHSLYLSFCKI